MAVATAGTGLVRKLSTRTIMGETPRLNREEKSLDLYVIAGVVRKAEFGSSDMGPWTAFRGEFIAKRLSDGSTFKGVKAFVPQPLQGMLEEALGNVDEGGNPIDEEGKRVKKQIEFAAKVGIVADPDTPIGFQYTAENLLDVQESDALGSLLERVAAGTGQSLLPAPKRHRGKKELPE